MNLRVERTVSLQMLPFQEKFEETFFLQIAMVIATVTTPLLHSSLVLVGWNGMFLHFSFYPIWSVLQIRFYS